MTPKWIPAKSDIAKKTVSASFLEEWAGCWANVGSQKEADTVFGPRSEDGTIGPWVTTA